MVVGICFFCLSGGALVVPPRRCHTQRRSSNLHQPRQPRVEDLYRAVLQKPELACHLWHCTAYPNEADHALSPLCSERNLRALIAMHPHARRSPGSSYYSTPHVCVCVCVCVCVGMANKSCWKMLLEALVVRLVALQLFCMKNSYKKRLTSALHESPACSRMCSRASAQSAMDNDTLMHGGALIFRFVRACQCC